MGSIKDAIPDGVGKRDAEKNLSGERLLNESSFALSGKLTSPVNDALASSTPAAARSLDLNRAGTGGPEKSDSEKSGSRAQAIWTAGAVRSSESALFGLGGEHPRSGSDLFSRKQSVITRFSDLFSDAMPGKDRTPASLFPPTRLDGLAADRRAERSTIALPDGATVETTAGRPTTIRKGDNAMSVEYDEAGRISRITENINGVTTTLDAGKDFKSGDATINKDGDLKVISPDGKYSYTLKHDFSRIDRLIGDNPDGSNDKMLAVRTADGVTRQFIYQDGQVIGIRDTLPTNNGKPLVEETFRIGMSNIWEFKSSYGARGQRSAVSVGPDGEVKFAEVKRPSRPNDLVDLDNSDRMHQDLASARQHFAQTAAAFHVFKGSAATTESWAQKFEQRCRDLAHHGRKSPTDNQIIKTYQQLELILKGQGNGISAAERRALVESAMREYADPNKYINQGSHPSCGFNMVERHVVQTRPEEHARVLQEAVNKGRIISADGKRALKLSQMQIKPDRESAAIANGRGWGGGWSYSNKVFQIAAIKLGHPGYSGNGHGFSGATEEQCRRANEFLTGERKLPILNRWWGGKPSFNSLQTALKHGTIGYMVPGHMMTIDDARVIKGVQYVHVDNSWGGSGDGWRQWARI